MTDMTVAKTILAQLGGNHFIAMTGSKNFIGDESTLSFKVGHNDKGVTHVRITLDASDTYTMTFSRVRGRKVTELATDKDVYAEDLQKIFTSRTGMETSLGSMGRRT